MARTTANKRRAEVALPEAGEGVFLRFTVDALEALESEFGEDYLNVIMAGLNKARVKVFRTCVDVALTGAPDDAMESFPWDHPLEPFQTKILDALYLSVTGRTFEEQQSHEDELYAEQLEKAQENPRMAAALFSRQLAESPPEQASDPTKAES